MRIAHAPEGSGETLLSFEFLGLCLLIFLSYCNNAVFYSFYVYLESIGVPQEWRGLLIGTSSLATILFFLAASPFLTCRNAPRTIYTGAAVLLICGVSYLYTRSVPGLLLVRVLHGAGIYLISASAMTLLVTVIPRERSGQAFGIYSVAMLLPFSIVPLVFDRLSAVLPSLAHGYALVSLALLPATLVNLGMARRRRLPAEAASEDPIGFRTMFASVATPSIGLLLLVNMVYYVNFSSLFFLAKPLFLARGIGDVGFFFTIQTMCMVAVRLLGNRLFDMVSKVLLIRLCYGLTGLGFALIYWTGDLAVLHVTALVLGIGMGVGVPSLNAFMFSLSEPRLRGLNANLMMMSLQFGSFCGPFIGSFSVSRLGYDGFLLMGMVANGLGILLSLYFSGSRARQRFDR